MRHYHFLAVFVLAAFTLLTGAGCQRSATAAEAGPPATAPGGEALFYNVRAYGATGDGKTLDSPAIDKAIAAANAAGGGTVVVPAGTYLSGSIHLKSHVTLRLEAGSTILGAPQELKAYDPPEPFEGRAYQDGGHTYFHNSLIWGEKLTNVAIVGQGMIHGGGLTSADKGGINTGSIGLGNKAIALKLCTGVLIRDVTIFHGGHFAMLLTGCDNVTLDNLTIDTNRDGIDLDCCRNCVVSNCRVNSPTDDGICPKSSFALGKPVVTENMTITNCQVSGFEEGTLLDGRMIPSKPRTGRIKFGTEANGGFRNVTISNCTFRQCRGLALEQVDGGVLENFTITNLAMYDVAEYPIFIRLGARNRGPEAKTGSVKDILISNVLATRCDSASGIHISGVPGHPVKGIRLENVRISSNGGGTPKDAERKVPEMEDGYPEPHRFGVMPSYGLFLRHAGDIELANIRFSFRKPDQRPALFCQDVDGLEIENLKAETVPGVAPARMEEVKGLVIRNSPVLQSSTTTNP